MRHFRIFRPSFGLMLRMLAGVAVCAVSSSCTDDTFDKHGQQGASGMLAFDVAAPGSWADGSAATRVADKDISIRKLTQSGGGKPLYLVTEIAEVAVDTAASNAITRGTTTTGETFKNHSFGLSAICYTGEWPEEGKENKWTTNFAHNIEVSYTESGKWESKKSLYRVGSENIKFFAYSPYSAATASSESSEEGAADAGDATPSVIHSAEDTTGIPTLTYTVPTDVTKQIDLMYATADCDGNGTGDAQNGAVKLEFQHALTAVTIKTGKKMLAGKVTGIEISGVHGSGIYPIGTKEWETTGEAKCTFSIDKETILNAEKDDIMTGDGTNLNPDDKGYTFMMIPQALSENATLKISFTDKLTSTERTLTAKLKDFTKESKWEIGKQYTYSINSTGIVIEPVIEWSIDRTNTLLPDGGQTNTPIPGVSLYTELTEEEIADSTLSYLPVSGFLRNVKINSYANVTQVGHETKKVLLPFKMEYLIEGETTWQTAYDSNTSEKKSEYEGSIKLPAQPAFDELQKPFKSSLNAVANDETEAVNLAAEGSMTGVHESANCYIVNKPGYYKFPTYYGNMWPTPKEKAYKYTGKIFNDDYPEAGTKNDMRDHVLQTFVGHNNLAIPDDGKIPNIHDAVLIWQDSPELVVDVQYDSEFVYFRVLEETLTQGNAIIAVRDMSGTILWSWHIWATHYNWENGIEAVGIVTNEFGKNFIFAPCNLGYCDSQSGSPERDVQIRFTSILSDGVEQVVTTFEKTAFEGVPVPTNGIFTLYQPKMIESIAGDNTYYQWGRKDPMLPGVFNSDTRKNIGVDFIPGKQEQLDMVNKTFYSTPEYRFASSDCGRSIGESIKYPYEFFMHSNPNGETGLHPDNYMRRHWHDGSKADYSKKTVMNYWNSQLDLLGKSGSIESPNNLYVYKTIYDPSPAGYKIPPPAAFAVFFKEIKDEVQPTTELWNYSDHTEDGFITNWILADKERTLFTFPATGLRDMAIGDKTARPQDYGTWPAHSKLTFIVSSGFLPESSQGSGILFSIDVRSNKIAVRTVYGTNNSYGFTLRPIRDGQTGD